MLPRLKLLRQENGLSQRALAEELGISQQSINKYENHNIEPDIAMLKAIADYFGTTIDYLVELSDVRQRPGSGIPEDLTPQEAALLCDYRQLSNAERASIDCIISNYMFYKK